MDPLAELKVAALGVIVRSVLDKHGKTTLEIPFSELEDPPGVGVDADPETKKLSVYLEDD